MPSWIKVATIQEVPEATGLEVVAGDRIVALFRIGDEVVALDGICPHAGGPLAQGRVNQQIVTCPWHGWQFHVATGRHCLNANLTQPRVAIRVENDEIFVEVP
ncbi:MAG: nagAb [Planctomycetaceae bacterium]|nr:nagAb [Planctomycetaceae bacterium]